MLDWYSLSAFGQQRMAELRRSAGWRMIVLARGETLSVRIRRKPLTVSCVAGQLWITVDGCLKDVLLSSGSSTILDGTGTVVVQALHEAAAFTLELSPIAPLDAGPAGGQARQAA